MSNFKGRANFNSLNSHIKNTVPFFQGMLMNEVADSYQASHIKMMKLRERKH